MVENRSKPDQYMLRLPAGMRDRIKVEAELNARTMNAEIVKRLADSFEGYNLEIDFDNGGFRRGIPSSWFREQSYRELDEEEIITAIMRYTDELEAAVKALRRVRGMSGKKD